MLNNSLLIPSLSVALGAIPGVVSRYLLISWLNNANFANLFPLGTFAVNVSGAFLMGLVSSLTFERWGLSEEIRLCLTTGFLGSYTTFSTYELEAVKIFMDKTWPDGGLYWLGTPVLGIIGFSLGAILAKSLEK
jgi:CrcB protein